MRSVIQRVSYATVKVDGEIISNHLSVKNTLDLLRYVAKDKKEAIKEA